MGQSLVSTWLVLGKVRALLLLEEFLVQMVRCLASNSGLAQISMLMLAPVEWVEVVGGIVSGVAEMVCCLLLVTAALFVTGHCSTHRNKQRGVTTQCTSL